MFMSTGILGILEKRPIIGHLLARLGIPPPSPAVTPPPAVSPPAPPTTAVTPPPTTVMVPPTPAPPSVQYVDISSLLNQVESYINTNKGSSCLSSSTKSEGESLYMQLENVLKQNISPAQETRGAMDLSNLANVLTIPECLVDISSLLNEIETFLNANKGATCISSSTTNQANSYLNQLDSAMMEHISPQQYSRASSDRSGLQGLLQLPPCVPTAGAPPSWIKVVMPSSVNVGNPAKNSIVNVQGTVVYIPDQVPLDLAQPSVNLQFRPLFSLPVSEGVIIPEEPGHPGYSFSEYYGIHYIETSTPMTVPFTVGFTILPFVDSTGAHYPPPGTYAFMIYLGIAPTTAGKPYTYYDAGRVYLVIGPVSGTAAPSGAHPSVTPAVVSHPSTPSGVVSHPPPPPSVVVRGVAPAQRARPE